MTSVMALPSAAISGAAEVPGDKSISHRAVMLGALAVGESRIEGLLEGEDVLRTVAAMRAMGAEAERRADGRWHIWGRGIGATGQAVGEVCFNTSITGYQEILTDPSYCRQIVTLTSPHIGNTGTNSTDMESSRIHASGLIVREASAISSNWRCWLSLSPDSSIHRSCTAGPLMASSKSTKCGRSSRHSMLPLWQSPCRLMRRKWLSSGRRSASAARISALTAR